MNWNATKPGNGTNGSVGWNNNATNWNDTQSGDGNDPSSEFNRPVLFNLSSATCSGNFYTAFNKTALQLLNETAPGGLDGKYLSECNKACAQYIFISRDGANATAYFYAGPGDLPKNCECSNNREFPLKVVQEGFVHNVLGLGSWSFVQVNKTDSKFSILQSFAGGKYACSLNYNMVAWERIQPPPPPRPEISTGIWNNATQTINAVDSTIQYCQGGYPSRTCVLDSASVELSAGVWNIRAFGVLASSSGGQYSICLFDTDVGSTIPYSCSSPCFSGGADTCTLDTGIVYRVTRPTVIKMSAEGDSPNSWWFGTSGAFGLPKTPLFRISATFERPV